MSVKGLDLVTIRNMLDEQNAAFIKKYYANDSDGYPTDVYYAQAEAIDTAKCLRQRLVYATVSGVKSIIKESWEEFAWDSSWDI